MMHQIVSRERADATAIYLNSAQVLTVLVVGHRGGSLALNAADQTLVHERLENTIQALRDGWRHRCPNGLVRILTGTDDGTDREAACIAAKLGLELHLLSPHREGPLNDEQQRAERKVWLNAPDDATDAVGICDEVALAFADIILVLWDEAKLDSRTSNTRRLAFKAASTMKPLIWLNPAGEVRVLDRSKLTSAVLELFGSPYPETSWLTHRFGEALTQDPLGRDEAIVKIRRGTDSVVQSVFDPCSTGPTEGSDSVVRRLTRYKARNRLRWHTPLLGSVHKAMMKVLNAGASADPKDNLERSGESAPPAEPPLLFSTLNSHLTFADEEANTAGNFHRGATWVLYGASALAVFAAVAGTVEFGGHYAAEVWPYVELIVLGAIVAITRTAQRQYWHERWIGYRYIAEQLRYVASCLPLLGIPRPFLTPCWTVEHGRLKLAKAEEWVLQRALATEGLPVVIPAREAGTPDLKCLRAVAFVEQQLVEQRTYHVKNHHKLHTVHNRLHIVSRTLFGFAVGAVTIHLLVGEIPVLLFCTAFFPALAAAVHGLMTKLEIARVSAQSEVIAQRIATLAETVKDGASGGGWWEWVRLRHLTTKAVEVLSDENNQWQQLIGHQETDLPA
ncbi:hypothetical protein [Azospirillum sp. TSO5]|uniref:hypothetical protein n=1 Tax=Azospirillum sp. TSO5 TaxID=716760 RepID=UPI000D60D72A|nr:hypothetical protein [Azospirillum sp. TSO5]PWC86139.1 hypothetical protein TSO5_25475 [Azospirillum sp. TSO5]